MTGNTTSEAMRALAEAQVVCGTAGKWAAVARLRVRATRGATAGSVPGAYGALARAAQLGPGSAKFGGALWARCTVRARPTSRR